MQKSCRAGQDSAHCKSGGSTTEAYFTKIAFLTVEYDFCICYHTIYCSWMVGAYFSLIGCNPKVSHLLAGIAISIADVMKGL